MNKTTLYLPESTQRRLRELAKRSGRQQSELIRQALERYLDEQPSAVPGSVGAGEDSGLGARDSEDWLRANWHKG